MGKHWNRLRRSLSRRWREWRLPRGYERLGTRYGGWWLDTTLVGPQPLLIDCGLGEDISFPAAFLQRFSGAFAGGTLEVSLLDEEAGLQPVFTQKRRVAANAFSRTPQGQGARISLRMPPDLNTPRNRSRHAKG